MTIKIYTFTTEDRHFDEGVKGFDKWFDELSSSNNPNFKYGWSADSMIGGTMVFNFSEKTDDHHRWIFGEGQIKHIEYLGEDSEGKRSFSYEFNSVTRYKNPVWISSLVPFITGKDLKIPPSDIDSRKLRLIRIMAGEL